MENIVDDIDERRGKEKTDARKMLATVVDKE